MNLLDHYVFRCSANIYLQFRIIYFPALPGSWSGPGLFEGFPAQFLVPAECASWSGTRRPTHNWCQPLPEFCLKLCDIKKRRPALFPLPKNFNWLILWRKKILITYLTTYLNITLIVILLPHYSKSISKNVMNFWQLIIKMLSYNL